PWQCEINGKYDAKRNLDLFSWEGRRIAMVPPKVTPQLSKTDVKVKEKILKTEVRREVFEVDEALVIENSRASSFQMRGIHVIETKVNAVRDWSSPKTLPEDFQAERKETGVSYPLVMKGVNDVMENAIPSVIKPFLAEFGKIVIDDTLDALPPFRNIQHQIDLNRKTTLLVSVSNEVLGFDSIKELYVNDEDYGNIWMELETKQYRGEFILLNGYLFKGLDKIIASVESRFYWPQLKKNVGAFLKRCVVCQEGKGNVTPLFVKKTLFHNHGISSKHS
nr:transposon Ty3-I Gag-Pol polyprotein [Tanacetum cinerariifolium]